MTDQATQRSDKRPTGAPAGAVKQVRLNLVYIDLWSAVKVSAWVALALSVAIFVTVILTWLLPTVVGVVGALEGVIGDILGEGSNSLLALFDFGQVLLLAFVGALINLVSLTVLGSLSAVLYNAIAKMTGGLNVGFTNS